MKITRKQLRQLIKENLNLLIEAYSSPAQVAREALRQPNTNEEKLINLIVDSLDQYPNTWWKTDGALAWVDDVYKSAREAAEQWQGWGEDETPELGAWIGEKPDWLINAIQLSTRPEEIINSIVRMFVDSDGKLTGPLDRAEGSELRTRLQNLMLKTKKIK